MTDYDPYTFAHTLPWAAGVYLMFALVLTAIVLGLRSWTDRGGTGRALLEAAGLSHLLMMILLVLFLTWCAGPVYLIPSVLILLAGAGAATAKTLCRHHHGTGQSQADRQHADA